MHPEIIQTEWLYKCIKKLQPLEIFVLTNQLFISSTSFFKKTKLSLFLKVKKKTIRKSNSENALTNQNKL